MSRTVDKLVWLLIGATAGAGIALLYAPKPGRDTRKYLVKKSAMAREAVANGGEEILERGREIYKRGAHIARDATGLLERGRKLMAG